MPTHIHTNINKCNQSFKGISKWLVQKNVLHHYQITINKNTLKWLKFKRNGERIELSYKVKTTYNTLQKNLAISIRAKTLNSTIYHKDISAQLSKVT